MTVYKVLPVHPAIGANRTLADWLNANPLLVVLRADRMDAGAANDRWVIYV